MFGLLLSSTTGADHRPASAAAVPVPDANAAARAHATATAVARPRTATRRDRRPEVATDQTLVTHNLTQVGKIVPIAANGSDAVSGHTDGACTVGGSVHAPIPDPAYMPGPPIPRLDCDREPGAARAPPPASR